MKTTFRQLCSVLAQQDLGAAVWLYDKQTGASAKSPPSLLGALPAHFSDDAAFFLGVPSFNEPDGWVWTPGGGYAELLERSPNHVVALQADGQRVVWVESASPDAGVWPPGFLYSAPYATTKAAVVATQERALPPIGPSAPSTIGSGYFVVYSGGDNQILVIRLSDAHLWRIDIPADPLNAALNDIVFVDDTYVFFETETEIYRQRLEALGPGE